MDVRDHDDRALVGDEGAEALVRVRVRVSVRLAVRVAVRVGGAVRVPCAVCGLR